MQTAREYLFFSILSYYSFPENSEGTYIREVFKELEYLKWHMSINPGNLLREELKEKGRGKEYFKEEVEKWQIYKIDDRTGNQKSKSGFFAIVFVDDEQKYVIAYRGSETYPFEEAYKDFIETDLMIGLGRKPLQFWEGLEVYENLLKEGIPKEDITITGHSLGGAIAQFVAVMSHKKYNYCPSVCTWNSVGIKREGIIGIEDFIPYEEVIETFNITQEEKEYFMEFKDSYKDFIMKELKKEGIIKDNRTLLVYKDFDLYFNIDDDFLKVLTKQTNFKTVLGKMSAKRGKELILNERVVDKLFRLENLSEEIKSAKKFIDELSENKIFNEKIINFCHSKDFVSSLFPHIGTTYQVDLEFKKKDTGENKGFFSNLKMFNRAFQEYHFEDVFIPLLDKRGIFTQRISVDYLASLVRKVIYLEKDFSLEFLKEYYSREELPYMDIKKFREELETGLTKSEDLILYKIKSLNYIKQMTNEEILDLWKKVLEKLPSPYSARDIYDIIIFRKNYQR